MSMRIPSVIIFDLDGTLYDYDYCHTKALNKVISKCIQSDIFNSKAEFLEHYASSQISVKNKLGRTAASHSRILYFKTMTQKLIVDEPLVLALELSHLYWEEFFNSMLRFDGLVEFIQFVKAMGCKIAILSDMTLEIQIQKLNRLGLTSAFDFVLTSEEIGVEKPDPVTFELVLHHFSTTPEKAWMIGDNHERDIIGAQTLGFAATFTKIEKDELIDAEDSFSNYFELRDLIHARMG